MLNEKTQNKRGTGRFGEILGIVQGEGTSPICAGEAAASYGRRVLRLPKLKFGYASLMVTNEPLH